MSRFSKKLVAIALVLCMLFSVMPLGVIAEDAVAGEAIGGDSVTITKIVAEDQTVLYNYDGYWYNLGLVEDGVSMEYFWYQPEFKATVYFSDGGTYELDGTSDFEYAGQYYTVGCYDFQSFENQWQLGETYEVKGFVGDYEFTFNTTVEETFIESVVIPDLYLIEGSDGDVWNGTVDGEEVSYFQYNSYPRWQGTIITLKDGTVFEGNSFDYMDAYYGFNVRGGTSQSYYNQWTVGNTYVENVNIAGYETTMTVHICENPIESISVNDKYMLYGDTETDYYYDEETGTEYEWERYTPTLSYDDVTITLKDGSVITGDSFEFKGTWHHAYSTCDQAYDNQWGLGDHEITVTLCGVSTTFTLSIIPSPVESIEVKNKTFIENLGGYFTSYWDEEIGDTAQVYMYYEYPDTEDCTITLTDGTVINDTEFIFNGERFSIEVYSDQSCYNPWGIGDHEVTVKIGDVSSTYTISIVETPVANVEFAYEHDVLMENGDGYEVYHYDENGEHQWFRYYSYNIPCKVTLKDGTVFEYGYEFEYEGETYHYEYNDNQSYDNQWGVGTNYVSVNVAGYVTEYPVIVASSNSNDEYEYLVYGDNAIITECYLSGTEIVIPSEIDGYTVTGISSMGEGVQNATSVVIPDTVTSISYYAFGNGSNIKTVTIGSGIEELDISVFEGCAALESVTVSEDNPYLCSVDGVVYDKAVKTVIFYPFAKEGPYLVPATVTDVDILLYSGWYGDLDITFSEDSENFVTVDGVTYDKDMTTILVVSKDISGAYDMPDTVTSIANLAFQGCTNLTSVSISPLIQDLVYYTFADCTALESVELPVGLKSIEMDVFSNTPSLTLIELPNSLVSIGTSAFRNSGLTSLTLPESVKYVGYRAFEDSNIATLDLGSVEEIDTCAFSGTKIVDLVLPDSVEAVYDGAFSYCSELRTVDFGDMCTVGYEMFYGSGLTEITIPETIEYIGSGAFAYSDLESITFEGDTISIGNESFAGCPLKELDIPDNIEHFGEFAFSGTDITSIAIPELVVEITYGSFANCENLETIEIPESVIQIGGSAFDNTAWYNAQADGLTYPAHHVLYDYKGTPAENTVVNVNDGVLGIGDYAFEEKDGISEIYLPASLQHIGYFAFHNVASLEKVQIDAENEYFYNDENGVLFNRENRVVWAPNQVPDKPILWVSNFAAGTPDKTHYQLGEELDTTGLTLEVYYDDDTIEYVTEGFITSGYDMNTSGWQYVYVYYMGYETSYQIYVEDGAAVEPDEPVGPNEPIVPDEPDEPVVPDEPEDVFDPETDPYIQVGSASGVAGSTATLDLSVINNAGFTGLHIGLVYDSDNLTLSAVNNKLTDMVMTQDSGIVWDGLEVYAVDGSIADLTFEISDTAPEGDYKIQVVVMGASDAEFSEFHIYSVSGTLTVCPIVYGDANDDGSVTVADVAMLRAHLANLDPITNESTIAIGVGADANGDGKVSVADVVLLRQYLAAIDVITGESSVVLGPQ